jgi:hypothetical protein
MTNEADPSSMLHDERSDALTRVRQLDSTIEEAAVRVYMSEIADADALLDTPDLGDASPSISFSAVWRDGDGQ